MIDIRNLKRNFGGLTAVDDVSLSVGKGEILGFIGPNGAGKTTTMRVLCGALKPTSGRVFVDGIDVDEEPLSAQRHIGYMPENSSSYPEMTVEAFLSFMAEIRGIERKERKTAIERAVDRAGLERVYYRPIETLSKGYKRRVGFAGAILHDPDVLILDEPTEGLDPNQKTEMRSLIAGLSKEKVVIVSTHILEEVEAICSRLVIIDRGKIVADGKPEELVKRSARYNGVLLNLSVPDVLPAVDLLKTAIAGGVRTVCSPPTPDLRQRVSVRPLDKSSIVADVAKILDKAGIETDILLTEQGLLQDVFKSLTNPGKEGETS